MAMESWEHYNMKMHLRSSDVPQLLPNDTTLDKKMIQHLITSKQYFTDDLIIWHGARELRTS